VRAVVALELGRTALYRQPQLDQLEFLIWARGLLERGFSWPSLPTKGPGYAVLLAGLLHLFGGSFPAVRLAQAALGSVTCVLAAALARRFFGDGAAVAGGVLLALYGPLAYVDTAFLAEGPFLLLLVAALLVFTLPGRPLLAAAGTGVLLGLAALVRATALGLVPALALVALLAGRRNQGGGWGKRAAAAALVVAAALAVVLPVSLPMGRTTGGSLVIQGYGGLNFLMGNDPAGRGLPAARLGGSWDRLEGEAARQGLTGAAEQDRFFLAKARRAIAADPLGWLRVLAAKAFWLLQAEEIRDSHSFYFFRSQSSVLAWLPGWGLLFPLAVWGIVVAVRRRRVPAALVVYLAVFAATCVGIIMASRYRLPMVPALAAFAGAGAAAAAGAPGHRRWRELALCLGVLAAAAVAAHLRRDAASRNLAEEWALSGSAELSRGDREEATAAFRQALDADPGSALAWDGLGELRLAEGDLPGTREALERSLALNPDFALAHHDHARALLAAGEGPAAVAELRRALELRPQDFPSLELLGPLLLSQGEVAGAEEVFHRLTALQPSNVAAELGLARIAGARRQPAQGVPHARRAAELAPESLEAWMTLALLAVDAGEADVAATALARAAALAGEEAPQVLWGQALLERLRGDREAVDATLRRLLRRQPGFADAARLLVANAAERGRRAEAEAFLAGLPAVAEGGAGGS
jgi:tetratricopeptide (TPR) repeat protein